MIQDLLAQETKKHADEKKESGRVGDAGLLLQHGIVEGGAARNGLNMLIGRVVSANFLFHVS